MDQHIGSTHGPNQPDALGHYLTNYSGNCLRIQTLDQTCPLRSKQFSCFSCMFQEIVLACRVNPTNKNYLRLDFTKNTYFGKQRPNIITLSFKTTKVSFQVLLSLKYRWIDPPATLT